MVKSSYNSSINYGEIFNTLMFFIKPKKILEFGILEGFSLDRFITGSSNQCEIVACDIFEDFVGNHAKYDEVKEKYAMYPNVLIKKCDFYQIPSVEDDSIDIIHIDVANDQKTYQFAIESYLPKLKTTGVMILEGGSIERDEVYWMEKYQKPKINPYLMDLKEKGYNILIIGDLPSLTIISRN